MHGLLIALRVLAVLLLAVSMLHLTLALGADVLLGVRLPDEVVRSPGLSSQNRFFGVTYALYAAVLWAAAGDLHRYEPLLRAALLLTVVGGLSRLVSWGAFGAPPGAIVALLVSELAVPPILLLWLRSAKGTVPAQGG